MKRCKKELMSIFKTQHYTFKGRKDPLMKRYYQINEWVLKNYYSKTLAERYKCALIKINALEEKINNLMQLLGD